MATKKRTKWSVEGDEDMVGADFSLAPKPDLSAWDWSTDENWWSFPAMVASGILAPGINGLFSGAGLGAVGSAAATGATLGGANAALNGQDILKAMATGAITAGAGNYLLSQLPPDMFGTPYFAPDDYPSLAGIEAGTQLPSALNIPSSVAQTLSDSSGNAFNFSNSGANPYSPMLGGGGGETFPTNLAPQFPSPAPSSFADYSLAEGNFPTFNSSLNIPNFSTRSLSDTLTGANLISPSVPSGMFSSAFNDPAVSNSLLNALGPTVPDNSFMLPEPITYGPTPGAPVFPNGVDSISNAASSPTGYVDPYSSGSITGTSVAEGAMTPASLGALGAGATGLGLASAGAATTGGAGLTGIAAALAAAGLSPEIAQSIATGLGSSGLLSGALALGGGYLQGQAAQDAANTSANAQIEAAKIAAEAAKFKPIGITTRFGSSNFTKDANGNVTGAGYNLSPEMLAQQNQLMGISGNALTQFGNAQTATAPMGDAAGRMMTLGNQYLATSPQAQAQKYMAEQQALLATGRERDLNQMLTGEFNRGTYGLSVGGTSTGMNAANPRLEAMFNAQRQQDLGLASQATQGGMDYAKFGAGMVGSGGDMLRGMYGVQSAAYDPYKTALGGATMIEGLGQNALDSGVNMGKMTSNAQSGQLLAQGMSNAANTMQQANSYSPWGGLLSGAGNQMQNYQNNQAQQAQNAQMQGMLSKIWGA